MEDKVISEKESLDLIARMIQNTRENVANGSGKPFLVWGYTTIAVAILITCLVRCTGNPYWNFLWFLIPVVGAPINMYLRNKSNKLVSTYVDKIVQQIWWVMGAGVLFMSAAAFLIKLPILFLVILLISMAVALTGLAIRFRLSVVMGLIGIPASLLFLYVPQEYQTPMFALFFALQMVIPGHILNNITKQRHV